MVHFTHQQYSATQRLQRPFESGHTNLVGSRNFLGYIIEQRTINFHSLCRCGVENLQSILFLSEARNVRFYHRMLEKVMQNICHLRSKLKMHNLTPPYNCVSALIRCSASTIRHKTRERLWKLKEINKAHASQKDLNHGWNP